MGSMFWAAMGFEPPVDDIIKYLRRMHWGVLQSRWGELFVRREVRPSSLRQPGYHGWQSSTSLPSIPPYDTITRHASVVGTMQCNVVRTPYCSRVAGWLARS
jgi:hypothetical protein